MSFIDRALAKVAAAPPLFLQHWGYPILFLLVLLEGIPFVGFVIPGQSVAVLAGFFAKLHVLRLGMVLLVTFLGAVIGDAVAYGLGRRWGHAFLIRHGKRFLFGEKEYRELKRLLARHPGKAIVIGRFHSVTRVFAPFIAGSTQMGRGRFMAYNVVAALLWSLCFVLVGYVFGQGFLAASRYIGTFALISLVLIVFIAFGYRRLQRFAARYQHRILSYPVGSVLTAGLTLYIVGAITDNVTDGGALVRIDAWVSAHIPALWSPAATAASLCLSSLFYWPVITLISVALFILLLRLRRRRTAAVFASSMLLAFALETGMKELVARPRPLGGLTLETSASFPSGHATMAAVFFAFLLWAFRDEIVRRLSRLLFAAATLLLPLLVGLSRIYLNVHWLSDVLAGWALGLFSLAFVLLGFHVFKQ